MRASAHCAAHACRLFTSVSRALALSTARCADQTFSGRPLTNVLRWAALRPADGLKVHTEESLSRRRVRIRLPQPEYAVFHTRPVFAFRRDVMAFAWAESSTSFSETMSASNRAIQLTSRS